VLDDPFWRVRHAAVRALLALGGDDARLARAIADATPASDRAHAALAYLRRRVRADAGDAARGAEAGPVVAQGAVADADPAVVAARLEAGRKAPLAELVEYLGDSHEALRAAAAARLADARDTRALLAAALWLEEPRIPHAAGTVVALLDALPDVEELLDEVLADVDARPGAAAWALSFVALHGRSDRLGAVVAALYARAALVRRAAVAALAELVDPSGPRGAVLLAARLADGDEDGLQAEARGRDDFEAHLEGWIAYARMVQPAVGEEFARALEGARSSGRRLIRSSTPRCWRGRPTTPRVWSSPTRSPNPATLAASSSSSSACSPIAG
jgi:hypothetical protein